MTLVDATMYQFIKPVGMDIIRFRFIYYLYLEGQTKIDG
jgi:hypothetical protein